MPFTVTMPKLSPTMDEGTIAKWHKKEGEYVAADELLLEITTDKATVEHTALDEGWLRKILLPEGTTAHVNVPLAIFTEKEKENIEDYQLPKPTVVEEAPVEKPLFVPKVTAEPAVKIHASPLARSFAKKHGIDLTTVKGSGPGGRITTKDLKGAEPTEVPTAEPGSYEEIPLTPMRKAIARRLQESKSLIPHFYTKQVIDAEPMVAMREQLKSLDLKVTFNDMMIRACALALRQHPGMNTGYNSVNQSIIQFKTIDISIAVTFEGGLITPIIRQADYKKLGQLSAEVRALVERARKGKLKEHEYKGGSFCISNLGMYGITEFTAVINPPQSAIIAIGGIEEQPVVKNGQVVPGKRLTLTLSADHRVIDGALAAQFLKTVQQLLENPVSLTL